MESIEKLVYGNFRKEAFDRTKDPYLAFFNLKYNYDFSQICYIVDRVGNKNGTINKLIYGCSIPKSIAELGDTRILSRGDEEFEKEVNWSILAIRRYQHELNRFLELKNDYEKSILLGEYDNASNLLKLIEDEVCYSLWGIEQRFLLIEIQKGLKENTSYLNDINTENKKWFIKYFSYFFSVKSEKELSVDQYNFSLFRLLLKYYENDNHVDSAYYNFKLNFLQDEALDYLPQFLAFESYHSIIDKYLALVRILQLEVNKDDKEKKEFIDSRLYYLTKKIKDPYLNRLRFRHGSQFENCFCLREQDKNAIRILDLYTECRFDKVEEELEKFLVQYPLSIELYVIYIKSILIQNKTFENIGGNSNSFQNIILKCLYEVFLKENDINDCLLELRKIAYNLSSIFSVSYFLVDLYNSEVNNSKTFEYMSNINSNFFNPVLLSFGTDSFNNYDMFEVLKESVTVNYLKLRYCKDHSEIMSQNLPEFREKVLRASLYQRKEDYLNAITEWQDILNFNNIKNFQVVEVLHNIYICKLALADYDFCIDLYVNNYFKNPLLVRNIDVTELKKQVKKNRYRSVTYSINLPIFYKLTDSDDYEIHTAYECYLLNQDVELPSEYVEKLEEGDEKHNFFLASICTLDIFKHSPFITSTNQKLNERIAVCQYLMNSDNLNKEEYRNEKERLTKKQIIQKGLQEIDESKIYVNEVGIIESELKNFKSIFNRYRALAELKSEKDLGYFIDINSDKVFSFQNDNKQGQSEGSVSKDPQFDIFKDMFYYILEKFLFSKYGLQQYLSARIRHGVLIGEIRPEFELLHLITEKEKGGGNYKANLYWKHVTNNKKDDIVNKFQQCLSDFSRSIDTLICDEMLAKYLQIKTEKKNEFGWLNYTFDDYFLAFSYARYSKCVEPNEIVNLFFLLLWEKTHRNLEFIRNQIRTEIKTSFLERLTKLEGDLINTLGYIPVELANNINEARVKIETKLSKIARWFTITDSNISDFKLSKAIDVGHECVQNSYPEKSLQLVLKDESEIEIKGRFFPSLVDLLRIFLENIIQHSGCDSENIKTIVDVVEDDEMMKIIIKNPIGDNIDIKILEEKIQSLKLDLDKSMDEGNSGFHKALRILKSDLCDESNDMFLCVSESNTFEVQLSIHIKCLLNENFIN